MASHDMSDDGSCEDSTFNNGKEKRTSRACLACRKRKTACRLPTDEQGRNVPPCDRCKASALECVIGGSNRGGRRVRRKTDHDHENRSNSLVDGSLSAIPDDRDTAQSGTSLGMPEGINTESSAALFLDPALPHGDTDPAPPQPPPGPGPYMATRESSTGTGNIAFNELQNPSDALGILAQIASNGGGGDAQHPHAFSASHHGAATGRGQDTLDYALVRNGRLSMPKIIQLVQRYKHYYHPYFPLVPVHTLDAVNLTKTAREEPHLLTAILVIASRELTDEPNIFAACSEHMRSLVSELAAGGPGNVEAVEALLLLAEWTPYTSRSDAGSVGRGEEDREAWMHVGTALRIGYFLGLDRYSFAVRGDDMKDPQWQRKRLVWTACYISDRQISIRLGRAFWSRGPGPLTTLRKEDFPMLSPAGPGEEDFASIFQATLELTLLFSNVHDVLYSNPGNSMRSHLSGGYIKYIDDFRSAIYGWKSVWGSLTCSPNLKATLLMSYDYLRLYCNAFAFHATVKRAHPQIHDHTSNNRPSNSSAPGRVFYNNVGAVGDARFIYEGLDAAKSILSMVNTFVNPEKSLRFMPLRFYLYSIYSGVFLYRARCVGVLSAEEEQSVRTMVQETILRLERAGIGSQHPGSRYSQLLRLLWDKLERKDRNKASNNSTATLTNPYRPGSLGTASDPTLAQESPAVTEVMGDFSWTDLDAIGNFAVNGNNGAAVGDLEWWSGFLPADPNNFLLDPMPGLDDWSAGL